MALPAPRYVGTVAVAFSSASMRASSSANFFATSDLIDLSEHRFMRLISNSCWMRTPIIAERLP